jgi:hypothetical protein
MADAAAPEETDDHAWSVNGWALKAGFAARLASSLSRHFYALYEGAHFDAPERGLLAAMASAHPANAQAAPFARDAAQLLVQSFAEGFFSARRTHSPRRAVMHALAPFNRWLAAQAITQPLTPVSLTALNFQQTGLGVIHIGACQLYRHRAGNFLSLTGVDAWHGRDAIRPAHAIGAGGELVIDYLEEIAEPGDRFIILAGFSHLGPEPIHAAAEAAGEGAQNFARALLALLDDRSEDAAAIVIDIVATPPLTPASDLATLPIRPVPAEGALWDGFRVGKTIYRGRYTILKAAYDTLHDREVVLKIPLKSMLTDEIFAAGFVREAWIGATVRGTAVARYIDIPAERRNSLYLVMPHYHGETLQARLDRAPAVSLPEGIGIALQLCEAIGDLAALQIIHRDIKPDNILLLPGNALRLLDLGLAYLPGIDTMEAARPGGTIRYMAPELLRGQPASPRSEVYALAVTLYRMFAGGAFPFGQREARALARIRPDLPSWLGAALSRALSAAPEARFADAAAFAAALQLGLTTAPEDPAPARPSWRPTALQAWQAATFLFAALSLFLLLRAIR